MENIYIIISKYLSGTASLQEENRLMKWRSIDSKHEREFQELRETWQMTHAELKMVIPNKEHVWSKIVNNLHQVKPVKMYTRRLLYRAVGIAAILALVLGFSLNLFLVEKDEVRMVSYTAPSGQKAEVYLPDGTKVWLNSGSTLAYSTDYAKNNRSVKLDGQAFFDVVRDDKKQFDVSVGNVKVLVHGTAFDINGYGDHSEVEVVLLRGRVTVVSASTDKLLADMKPNQKAIFPKHKIENSRIMTCDAEIESVWRMGKMKIENEKLQDIVRKMERWYGVRIQLQNVSENKRYWLTIKTESLREMLEIVNRVTPITYTINGEEVIIDGRK